MQSQYLPSQSNGTQYHIQTNQQQQVQQGYVLKQIQLLISCVKQQQLCPELLCFKSQLFQSLKKTVASQHQSLQTYKQDQVDSESSLSKKNYKSIIYAMQMEKVEYLLKSYCRIRINKITQSAFYYFRNGIQLDKLMTKSEIDFLKNYVDIRYKYYDKNVFKYFPKNLKGFGGMELYLGKPEELRLIVSNQSNSNIKEPDMDQYVFVKLNRNPNEFRYAGDLSIKVPEGQSQIASSNEILFIPYRVAKSLMQRSSPGDLVLM